MKILWVNSDFLHPTTRGGQIRTLETLKRLHQRHEIHYAALYRSTDRSALERSAEYCTRPYAVEHQVPAKFTLPFFRQLWDSRLLRLPVAILRYRSAPLRDLVAALTRLQEFD